MLVCIPKHQRSSGPLGALLVLPGLESWQVNVYSWQALDPPSGPLGALLVLPGPGILAGECIYIVGRPWTPLLDHWEPYPSSLALESWQVNVYSWQALDPPSGPLGALLVLPGPGILAGECIYIVGRPWTPLLDHWEPYPSSLTLESWQVNVYI